MSKLNNVVGILCAVIVCTIGIISQQCNLSHQDRIRSAAESLYPTLVSFEFDGIEILESEKQILLYKHKVLNEHSSSLVRDEVATVSVDDVAIKNARLFKNIMNYCGGVFFAAAVTWNGEWSGICLYPCDPSLIPSQHISYCEDEHIYWLSKIPHTVIS